ncbi:hypothetical protein [Clostridium tagluense]|uniref:hypothetical protein n=1 Tax=Clostridium tagluense TaxID=360422 RepID=UPI001CF47037|nr:hypothetical protein [Clostridium tagluense]MCB2297799.1 hypothetical protein [Clostridium tagluense]
MSLDIIKSYLVSIGFNIDNASLNSTQQKMNQAETTVKSFAKNNSNSVASMKHSTADIGMLTRTSMDALGKIFPVIKGPLNQVMNHINLVKQVFNAFSKSVKKDMSEADSSVNKFQSGTSKKSTSVRDKVNNFTANKTKGNTPKSKEATTATHTKPSNIPTPKVSSKINNFKNKDNEPSKPSNVPTPKVLSKNMPKNILKGTPRGSPKTFKYIVPKPKENTTIKTKTNNLKNNDNVPKINNFKNTSAIPKIKSKNKLKNTNNIQNYKPKNTPIHSGINPLKIQRTNKNDSAIKPSSVKKVGNSTEDMSKGLATTSKAFNMLTTTSSKTGTALETFGAVGGTAIKGFSLAALGPLALIAAAIAAIAIAAVALTKFLGDLAKQDLGYQKLARQLWTTKQNAKEISMALKTMGVTMQDLWLSPQLLAQFNQLRKDSAELKLPDSFNKNIGVVQGLGFEFQRLKQAGTLAFQWLGSYILQYIAGPLNKIKVGLHNFNDGFLKAIPKIAKVIAIPIGVIIRLFLDLAQVVGFLGKTWGKIVHFIGSLLGKIPEKVQNIIKIIGLLALVIFSPLAAIVGLILIFDDLMTAIKGGKSVIGDWGKDFKDKVGKAALPFTKLWKTIQGFYTNIKKGAGDIAAPFIAFGEKVQSIFEYIGEIIDDIKKKINSIVKPIANAVNAVKGTPDNVVNVVKGAPGNILKAAQGIPGDIFSALKGAGDKISALAIQSKVNYAVPPVSSTKNTNSTSSSVANSNNKSSNTNTFNVYGTSPTSTASAIGKTLTGINIRNLQGVY